MKSVQNTSSLEYHQYELSIALDPATPRRLVPDTDKSESILDIGCGAGQTLLALPRAGQRIGVDVDVDALGFGRAAAAAGRVHLAAARGENLPFPKQSFDFVYSRVALPYMDIPAALSEMHRVLRPRGRLWLTLHPIRIPAEQFRLGNFKGKIYTAYVVLNGLCLHATDRTFRLLRGRCESFQTRRGMTTALIEARFSDIQFARTEHHFIVTATRS